MATTIDNICKVRDLIQAGDKNKILSAIGLLKSTYSSVNRNIERFLRDNSHKLEFTAEDLIETAMECKYFLGRLNQKINARNMVDEILKPKEITNETIRAHARNCTDLYTMVAHLTEFHNVMSFAGAYLKVLELQYEQGELHSAITMAIEEALGR